MEKVDKKNGKNNRRIIMWIFIAIVITAAVCYLLFAYIPQQNKQIAIQDYKKAIFDSMICQHECFLTNQVLGNVTQLLPDVNCVKNCTAIAKEKIKDSDFTEKELLGDNFFKEIQGVINLCKKESTIISGNSGINSTIVNNTAYFNCVPVKMNYMKTNYSYLS